MPKSKIRARIIRTLVVLLATAGLIVLSIVFGDKPNKPAVAAAAATVAPATTSDEIDPYSYVAPTPDAEIPPAPSGVTYRLTGSAYEVQVTMQTPTGTSQETVTLPYERTFHGDFGSLGFVYISAQNQGELGDVTCSIESDGGQIAENTSSGAYAIAQCDGAV